MENQEVQKPSGLQIEKIEMKYSDDTVSTVVALPIAAILPTLAALLFATSKGVVATCFSCFFGAISLLLFMITFVCILVLVKEKRIEKGLPVRPGKIISRYGIFRHTVFVLTTRVNTLIERWNRYCELKEAGYVDPLINEEQMHQWILGLHKETLRHVQAAEVISEMESAGDFKKQTASDDAITDTLGQVRAFEDQLRRCFDGVEHRLHSPLAVTANVQALEQEMTRDMSEASTRLARVAASRQHTTGL